MSAADATPVYLDPDKPIKERVDDLVGRMTLAEKISQTVNDAPAIERLGVPAYNWWNEALHGVARAGVATVFPQAIGMAASFDAALMLKVATAIGDEGRAKHHAYAAHGDRAIYKGLTFWSPNINIFRDPRWGRGHETYGECPYLTGRMGVAFVRGLQGDDETYLKSAACAKHYAVHSGPEKARHSFDATCDERDLWETYLPAFKALVKEANVEAVMGAYNRTNGEPCCASKVLLQDILRGEWGFAGHVVSDCGAIKDISENHHFVKTLDEGAAVAVKTGCDLNCGGTYPKLQAAVAAGLITEAEIDVALTHLFTTRMKLGLFDPPERVAYTKIPISSLRSDEHRALALEMERASIVMLKNDGALPLEPKPGTVVAVVGPTADDRDVIVGNYNGTPYRPVTILDGICEAFGEKNVLYARGCHLWRENRAGFTEALIRAEAADVVVACMGLSPVLEGEEGEHGEDDRSHIDLPGVQEELLQKLVATGKPVVLVLTGGSALAVNWADENVSAVLDAWYGGEAMGTAVADILTGKVSPSGRLPLTFYKSADDLPPFTEYAMANRTYRYFGGEPLYRFGYGLSYSKFEYADLACASDLAAGKDLDLTVSVTNAGDREAHEVVQVYASNLDAKVPVPLRQLVAFERVGLAAGEKKALSLTVPACAMSVIDDDGKRRVHPTRVSIAVGGCQPGDAKALARGVAEPVSIEVAVTGGVVEIER